MVNPGFPKTFDNVHCLHLCNIYCRQVLGIVLPLTEEALGKCSLRVLFALPAESSDFWKSPELLSHLRSITDQLGDP